MVNDTMMHGPSPILGPDGSPALRQPETAEIANPQLTGVRALWDETTAARLTPQRLAKILFECRRGDTRAFLELAEEMEERYPHYAAVLGTRKRALAGIEPGISAESVTGVKPEVLADVEALIHDPSFPDLIEDLADGLSKGFSVCEIMWGERGGKWWPVAYQWRDPKYFTFDYISRSSLRLAELGTIDGVELPPGKFVQHMPKLKTGIPIRSGLAYAVAWYFMLSQFTVKDWMTFMDVFGMPVRVGKYHPSATADERRSLLRAVSQIANDAAAIIPESMMIEFVEAKGNSQAPFEAASRFFNEQVSKLVLGQTMTSDNGSSLGQAKVHNEIRLEIKIADARQLAKTLNRDLIQWFVAYNYGAEAKCPRVELPIKKPEDVKALSAALADLVPLGLEVAQDDVLARIGLPAPEKGAKILKAPANYKPVLAPPSALNRALGHATGCQCHGCRSIALNNQIDPTDRLIVEGTDDWQIQMDDLIEPVLTLARRCKSYEEFSTGLDALFGQVRAPALEGSLGAMLKKAFELGAKK